MAEPGTLEWWLFNVPPITTANIELARELGEIVQEEHRARQVMTVAQRVTYEREVHDQQQTPE